jgi:tryptophan halogenase
MNINSICIVGGGSSGWMMASALEKHLPDIDVTLVESPNIPIIGVGEATIPYTSHFINKVLGFEEEEWMPYCDASYKVAIRFQDFSQEGKIIYHPFWTEEEAGYNGFDWAIKKEIDNVTVDDYYSSSFIAYHMSEGNKFSKLEGQNFRYAHHLDAVKFAQFCKSKFKGSHILATVSDVETDGKRIVSVNTDKGKIKADMFVDCTGFKALLIGQALKEPFHSISDTLLNDTALTCRIPYENKKKELEPFTDCTALSSGWAWNTPIWSRIGTGYVFSSKFQTESSAIKEYKQYLEKRFGKERVNNAKINTINFKTGKYERSWVGNCLALTLASGFIEPLESTGLAIICYQIEHFIRTILDEEIDSTLFGFSRDSQEELAPSTTGEYSAFKRSCYNSQLDGAFKEIHYFVLLHYINSKREDSMYWKYLKNQLETPKEFNKYITSLSKSAQQEYRWFPDKSHECILLGFNIPSNYSKHNLTWNKKSLGMLSNNEKKEILKELSYLDERKADKQSKSSKMLLLEDYLTKEIYHKGDMVAR